MVLAILEYPGTYTVTEYNDGAGQMGSKQIFLRL